MPEGSETPVLDTIAAINAVSLVESNLDPNTLILLRLAALVAIDAPALSYLAHVDPSVDAGVTLQQVQDVLVAVAPIVGTPRIVSASAKITEALGFAIAVAEAEIEAESGSA
jgi:alkylhydroperoxidase/carboxymuconolactone decarboxylase family protein YurZ